MVGGIIKLGQYTVAAGAIIALQRRERDGILTGGKLYCMGPVELMLTPEEVIALEDIFAQMMRQARYGNLLGGN